MSEDRHQPSARKTWSCQLFQADESIPRDGSEGLATDKPTILEQNPNDGKHQQPPTRVDEPSQEKQARQLMPGSQSKGLDFEMAIRQLPSVWLGVFPELWKRACRQAKQVVTSNPSLPLADASWQCFDLSGLPPKSRSRAMQKLVNQRARILAKANTYTELSVSALLLDPGQCLFLFAFQPAWLDPLTFRTIEHQVAQILKTTSESSEAVASRIGPPKKCFTSSNRSTPGFTNHPENKATRLLTTPGGKANQAGFAYAYQTKLSGLDQQEFRRFSKRHGTPSEVVLLAILNTVIFRYTRRNNMQTRFELKTNAIPSRRRTGTIAIGKASDPKLHFKGLLATIQRDLKRPWPDEATNTRLFTIAFLQYTKLSNPLDTMGTIPDCLLPQSSMAPLTVRVNDTSYELTLHWIIQPGCLDAGMVQPLANHFIRCLNRVVTQSNQTIGHLNRVTSAEEKRLNRFNILRKNPLHGDINALFQEQVRQNPEKTILYYQNQNTTYACLNQRVERIAAWLANGHLQPEEPVAIILNPQPDLVAAVLAVLRAGGAVLAFDTKQPSTRLSALLSDYHPRFCIAHGKLPFNTSELGLITLNLALPLPTFSSKHVYRPNHPNQCAYLMYTSGSMGKPLAAVATHQGILERLHHFWRVWPFQADDACCLKKSVSLIGAMPEIFAPLLAGCPLHIATAKASQDPTILLNYLDARRITRVWGSPSLMTALLDSVPTETSHLTHLRIMVSSGEAIRPGLAKTWIDRFPNGKLFNVYGSTEVASDVSLCQLNQANSNLPAIGRPFPTTSFYIVDETGERLPAGVPGRLWIAGTHLARCYWQNPTATACQFRPDPFATIGGSRIFDSGDRAFISPWGNTFLLGRHDHQLNIRGYRIEPAEIERTITRFPGVRAAAVTSSETDTHTKLISYLVQQPIRCLNLGRLRRFLRATMPDHMIPNHFQILDELPQTRSGKLDRRALKSITPNIIRHSRGYHSPRNTIERQLVALWEGILSCKRVGIFDHFFDLGGHSLLATRILAKIREKFGHRLPMAFFFKYQTVAEQAVILQLQAPAAAETQLETNDQVPLSVPLTPEQRGIWFQHQLAPETQHLHLHQAWLIQKTDAAMVIAALHILQQRHASLRMSFSMDQATPHFMVLAMATPAITLIDYRHASPPHLLAGAWPPSGSSGRDGTWPLSGSSGRDGAWPPSGRSFDLASPPWRSRLFLLPNHRILLDCCFHHLIADGWSLEIIARELRYLIECLTQQYPAKLPQVDCSFPNYGHWRAKRALSQPTAILTQYWRQKLKDLPSLSLYPDYPDLNAFNFHGREIRLNMPSKLRHRLLAWCRTARISPFHPCLASFALLLARRSQQSDLAVLTPFANRNDASLEQTVGMFVQTLILRMSLADTANFDELVEHARQTFTQAISHHGLAFADTLRAAGLRAKGNGHPALATMFAYHQSPPGPPLANPGSPLSWRDLAPKFTTSQFDLTLSLENQQQRMQVRLQYRSSVFNSGTIFRLGRQFLSLLDACLQQPKIDLNRLPWTPAEEFRRWYRTKPERLPTFRPIHQRVFQAAKRWPHRPACYFEDRFLTYEQLVRASYSLGRQLRETGLKPGDAVPIFARQSLELPVAWLACMDLGLVGMPVDPEWPPVRLRAALLKSKSQIGIWTGPNLVPADLAANLSMLLLSPSLAPGEPFASNSTTSPDWPIYAMFTSGSTGEPKAALIPHRGIANRFDWMDQAFATEPPQSVLQTTPPQYDSSIWEIFWPLTHGGQTILVPAKISLRGDLIAKQIVKYRITMMDSVPSVFQELLADLNHDCTDQFSSLKTLILGSEDFPISLCRRISCALPMTQQWNLYGPTEASIGCIAHQIQGDEILRIPIGQAIHGADAFILNKCGLAQPCGIPGELFLGGNCLGIGYMDQPRATAEAFLPNPFSNQAGARLYRTGDMVRRLAKGQLVFGGRIDHQLKVHGVRIEPGEVETHLLRHPKVGACVIVLSTIGHDTPQLTAYVVFKKGQATEPNELKAFLGKSLPKPFIPRRFIVLPVLPKNAAGKLDRKALPKPNPESAKLGFSAPRHRLEAILVRLFEQVLNRSPIGIFDSFFELGGHSLSAIRLKARIQSETGLNPALQLIFEKSTPAELAQSLASLEPQCDIPLKTMDRTQAFPLAYVQERLWFLSQLESNPSHYHIRLVKPMGAVAPLALELALTAVTNRHDLWHASIQTDQGQPFWKIHPVQPISLRCIDLSGLNANLSDQVAHQLAEKETSRPFNLQNAPLHHSLLLRFTPQSHGFVFVCHHIISDGWSMSLWEQEMAIHYRAGLQLAHPPLVKLVYQFPDIVAWQRTRFESCEQTRLKTYWRDKLKNVSPLRLIAGLASQPPGKGPAHEAVLNFTSEKWHQIVEQAHQHGMTAFGWTLSLLKVLLHRYSHQDTICVGTPVAGRDLPASEPLLGCFLNTLPLATDLGGNPSFAEVLVRVRETFLDGLVHQELPFERLVEAVGARRDLDHPPLFQVLLVWEEPLPEPDSSPGLFLSATPNWTHLSAQTKYDLTCEVRPYQKQAQIHFRFPRVRYPGDLAPTFASQFKRLIEAALIDPKRPIQSLPISSSKLSPTPPLTGGPAPISFVLSELVAKVARDTPNAIALIGDQRTISYQTMNIWVDRMATKLANYHFDRETIIAFSLPRSPLSVIVMLGILRAGYAFLALDNKLPQQRQKFILKDCQAKLVIVTGSNPKKTNHFGLPCLPLELENLAHQADLPMANRLLPDQLAYLVYTSGSTGHPKGIAVSHRAIVTYIHATNARYNLHQHDRIIQMAANTFDASLRDIFGSLIAGAQLIIPKEEEAGDQIALCGYLRQKRLTVIYSGVPSFLKRLADEAANQPGAYADLRLLISGGERLLWQDVTHFRHGFGNHLAVYNQYGLSETTVTITSYEAISNQENREDVPFGPALPYAQTYLLNKYLAPVPPHSMGQIFIAGPAHARCYWGRAKLTAMRFIPDPISQRAGARLFKTGDLAEFADLPHQGLRFLGRGDHQVKIRGQRVELAEVETCLQRHSAVAGCAVRFWEEPHPLLVAYLKVVTNELVAATSWRRYLNGQLPAVMIPDQFVILKEFPRLANNKIAYRQLPPPEKRQPALEINPGFADQPTLSLLAHIWSLVLKKEPIALHDRFFDLGGHSLLATQVLARIRQWFGIHLPLRVIFEKQSLFELAAAIDDHRLGQSNIEELPLLVHHDEQALVLSFSQKRLWFLEQLEPGRSRFNMPRAYRISGQPLARLIEAIGYLTYRHQALRTGIRDNQGEPVAFLFAVDRFEPSLIDLSGLPLNRIEEIRCNLAIEEARALFQINMGPLYRNKILIIEEDRHIILQTLHHLIGDGWSLNILENDLYQYLHNPMMATTSAKSAQHGITYFDWALWQQAYLKGETLDRRLTFWTSTLENVSTLQMSIQRNLNKPSRGQGDRFGFNIPARLIQRLGTLGHKNGCTLFMGLQAALQILVHRYSGQTDFCIGTPIANRKQTETESIVGFFVNTLALRAQIGGNPSYLELLDRVRQHALDAFAYGDLPFESLVKALGISRNLGQTPLFQILMVFHQSPQLTRELKKPTTPFQMVQLPHRPTTAKYDLSAHFQPLGEGLRASFIYDLDRFDDGDIRQFAQHFLVILDWVGRHPHIAIDRMSLVTSREKTKLTRWNQTTAPLPESTNLDEVFLAQANLTPEAIAIIQDRQSWSYEHLAKVSAGIAKAMRDQGVGQGDRVAIACHRCPLSIAAMLASFHLGATLVPLNLEWPIHRFQAVLDNSAATCILFRGHQLDKTLRTIVNHHWLDLDAIPIHQSIEPANPWPGSLPAYLLYTSGTSGQPKGVVGTHMGMVTRLHSLWQSHPFAPDEAGLLKKASIFIGSFTECFGPLGKGIPIVLMPTTDDRSPTAITRLMIRHRISRLWAFPSLLHAMTELIETHQHDLGCLKYIFASGEPLTRDLFHRFAKALPHTQLINIYGSTELSSDVALHRVLRQNTDAIPIGLPMANTQLWIQTRAGSLQPRALPGQLVVGGQNLAQAYWRQPALTALGFRPDPHSDVTGARLYHTSDWATIDDRNQVVLLARMDQQLKIRGYRIEPMGIERLLREHVGIWDCAVLAIKGKDKQTVLAAYVACRKNLNPASLRAHLGNTLPEYAIPSRFIFLEQLPRTQHGKLIPAKLPKPQLAKTKRSTVYLPPRNPRETILANIWAEVLGLERVGIRDQFFDLGGHSLLATQVRARIAQSMHIDLPLSALFKHQTLGALASHLSEYTPHPMPPISTHRQSIPIPSFAQERWWVLDRLEPGRHYQLLRVYETSQIRFELLEEALRMVIQRHEPLRTCFPECNSKPSIQLLATPKHPLQHIDLTYIHQPTAYIAQIIDTEKRRNFALHRQSGFRALVLHTSANTALLICHFHHIATDDWGLARFRHELALAYAALIKSTPVKLPDLPVSYSDFASWQRNWIRGSHRKKLLNFWQTQLLAVPPLLLPYDFQRPTWQRHHGSHIHIRFSKPFSKALVHFARDHQVTLFMVLFAGYRGLLQRLSDQNDFCIGTPIAHRTHPELEPLIGSCVNTLGLRIRSSKNPKFSDLLKSVRDETLAAFDHQALAFADLMQTMSPPRDPGQHPIFQVMFVELNTAKIRYGKQHRIYRQLFGQPQKQAREATLFDLTLYLGIERGEITGRLAYNTELFQPQTAQRFCDQFQRLLRQAMQKPQLRLGQINLFTVTDMNQIRRLWGGSCRPPHGLMLGPRIKRQLKTHPDRIAIVSGKRHLSKCILNSQVHALASHLQKGGLAPDVAAVICMQPSMERAIVQLAILRAGGVLIPIHPNQPEKRRNQRLNQCQPHIIVCDPNIQANLPSHWSTFPFNGQIQPPPGFRFRMPTLHPQHAAYMLFTSGSTGEPKLTVNHQIGMLNRMLQTESYTDYRSEDVILYKTPFEFDVSIWEFFWPILRGLRLELTPPEGHRDPRCLLQLISQRRITKIHFVPSMLSVFLEVTRNLHSLRAIFTSGEALHPDLCRRVHQLSDIPIHNLYGPTEAAVEVSHDLLDVSNQAPPSLGRPLKGNTIAILDTNLNPVNPNQTGELFLGGCQIARGYHHQARQTAWAFLPDPFSKQPGQRLYRSGDLGQFLQNGRIQFLGRRDHQIKLRGIRVELGEIENELRSRHGVRDAIICVSGSGENIVLTAYLILKPGTAKSYLTQLKAQLAQDLPGHLIPNQFIELTHWPKSASGKIDRHSLPKPKPKQLVEKGPKTATQKMLADQWQTILGQASFNLDDDFFSVGGNSLLTIRLANVIRQETGLDLPMSLLFQATTLRQQAAIIDLRTFRQTPVVTFNSGSQLGTWLFVHAADGLVHQYQPLAKALTNHGNAVGLQAVWEPSTQPSITSMAATLLQTIDEHRLKPPFHLVGWSMGGLLAYELARQMTRAAKPISHLSLIDCRRFDQLKPPTEVDILRLFLRQLSGQTTQTIDRVIHQVMGRTSADQIRFDQIWVGLSQLTKATQRPPQETIYQLFQTHRAIIRAGYCYQPQISAIPITLIHAAEKCGANHWASLCKGDLVEHQTTANHFRLLKPPHVGTIAKILAKHPPT